MLVIRRKKGERLYIGNDIEIVVTGLTRNGVRIGIVAPHDQAVVRAEVHDTVERLNREATHADPESIDLLFPSDAIPPTGTG